MLFFLDGVLVRAKIVQKSDGAMVINATVSSISIIISVEFLVKIATFFTDSLPVAPASETISVLGNDKIKLFEISKSSYKTSL